MCKSMTLKDKYGDKKQNMWRFLGPLLKLLNIWALH